jgi:hypothetical protein
MKQGILLNAVTMGITPPTTFGYSQVFLVEVSYADYDTGSVVLPYYNPGNPQAPYSGPGNAGAANTTIRQGQCVYQIKAGIPAPTNSQVAPTADPGWVGIYTITVANGAQTITAGNIQRLATAPFLATLGHLPQIPNGFQNWQWSYCTDTGTVNALVGTIAPVPLGLTPGLSVRIRIANTNTGATTFNLNGLGVVAVTTTNGAQLSAGQIVADEIVDLVYNGSTWQCSTIGIQTSSSVVNNHNSLNLPYCADTGTVNNVVAPFSPAITSVTAGNIIEVKIANTNTAASTITVNSLASVPIVDLFGNPLQPGEIHANEVALMIFNGSAWQLVNYAAGAGGLVNVQVFTTSGTYTPSPGATKALIFATGGGGGGEDGCGNGIGGGGGATAITLINLTGISSVPVTIGAGGSGAANAESNGGTTSFGTYAVAGGGYCGNGGGGTGGPNESGNGTGGTATAGLFLIRGGSGGGQYNVGPSGDGGASFWGDGGRGVNSGVGELDAHVYGGGGGGASYPSENAAGNGMSGLVVVMEF